MPQLRQQRRVVFSTKARIRGEDDDASVIARVHNVSERGIFVTSSRELRRGSEVRCRLFLGDERRVLRGKVAWVRPPGLDVGAGPQSGAGIEFVDLTGKDSELLRKLVTPSPEEEVAVDVWFTGMPGSVRCRAVVARDGLRLSTRLGFLTLGSEVKVTFENRGVRETRVGQLDAVVMAPTGDDGVPRVLVSVSTPDRESARGVISLPQSDEARLSAQAETPDFIPSTLVDEEALVPGSEPHRAGGSGPRGHGLASAVSPIPVDPMPPLREQSDKTMRVAFPLPEPSAAHGLGGMMSRLRGDRRVPSPLVLGALAIAFVMIAVSLFSGAFRDRPAGLPEPSTPAAPPAPAAAAAPHIDVEPLPATVTTGSAPEVTPLGSAATPPAAAAEAPFEARIDARHTEVFVPLGGSARRAQSYLLRSPAGMAVNLPRGKVVRSAGRFPVPGSGLVSQVWIEQKGAGVHLRFHFAPQAGESHLTVEDGGVRLVVDAR